MTKLTHEQIDAMEAGREMDAAVAELVMGWANIEEVIFIHRYADGHEKITGKRHKGTPPNHDDCLPPVIAIRNYSTDIAAAFQALDMFDRAEWDIDIYSYADHGGKLWRVSLRKIFRKLGACNSGLAFANTRPLAICRAALKAVT